MSEPKLISPMLDNYVMGDPISDHHGVRCCPAMARDSDDKYIVKIISVPASQVQLDALLLTGAYTSQESALTYFKDIADGVVEEAEILQKLSKLEGFISYDSWQVEPMENAVGYDIYLLSSYKKTLARYFSRNTMTHLAALNLGLDLCASLAVCRRSGYLYADLKPSNIFVSEDKEFRIGDLGFISLQSLKYASLPDKYRSEYTAPEISDAFSALNSTIDIYAAGLILYQAYNGGTLPFNDDVHPGDQLPVPLYADYEMAEIILKACAPNHQDRWQDPIQMGQAIISYMQRNGANDVPIVPSAAPVAEEDAVQEPEPAAEPASPVEAEAEAEEITESADDPEAIVYSEDDFGNLSFLDDTADDETAPEHSASEIEYDEVSDEVSDILTQADELIAHPAPDPVIPPEPIDVPIPGPILPEAEAPVQEETAEEDEEPEEAASEAAPVDTEEPEEAEEEEEEKKPKKHWLRNTFIVLIIAALLAGGFYYYQNYYLQGIESITLEGDQNALTVHVSPNFGVDTSEMAVVCYDTSGIKYQAPVLDDKAVFASLMPGRTYTVEVISEGFHKLYGHTTDTYSTPSQTDIVQFSAVTGPEDGSAILTFTIDGPDCEEWTLNYSAAGEGERSLVFTGHMVTVTGLTVGSTYDFTLVPADGINISGNDTITFTASKLVLPQNLAITGCIDNTLSAAWTIPEDASVASWTVHCFNENGYEETVVTTETAVTFEGIDPTQSYTIDVTAAGMSVGERVSTEGNAITVTNFAVDTESKTSLTLTWDVSTDIPEGGWILQYTADGSKTQEISCSENSAQLYPIIPGADYTFLLKAADGTAVLSAPLQHTVPVAEAFSGYWVSASDFDFNMCRYPGYEYWDRYDLEDSDYTSEFTSGEKMSFLVRVNGEYDTSYDDIVTVYVIRDASGNIVDFSSQTRDWIDMWYRNYCELDVPSIPETEGEYTITVFFNGNFAAEQSFTVHPNAAA